MLNVVNAAVIFNCKQSVSLTGINKKRSHFFDKRQNKKYHILCNILSVSVLNTHCIIIGYFQKLFLVAFTALNYYIG